jgi:quinol-cytochrome oxidoreductase complex cytochrome b subunit
MHTANTRSASFRLMYKIGFWLWIASFILLGWVGQIGISDTIVFVGQVLTGLYFFLLLFCVSFVGLLENWLNTQNVNKKD